MNDLRNLSGRELKTRSSDFSLSIDLTAHVTMTNYILNNMITNKISLNDKNNRSNKLQDDGRKIKKFPLKVSLVKF